MEQLRRGLHKEMFGVEVGPFYNPVVPRSEGWQTTVVDFTDRAGLLQRALSSNQSDMIAMSSRIEEVDIVWSGGPLDQLCLKRRPEGFDYFVASHVIEHIPNLIGFFSSLARLLRPEGIISLAVPDLRYCFDFYKAPTTTAGLLAAHRADRQIHAAETIFEAEACTSLVNGRGAWTREPFIIPMISGDLFAAYKVYREYIEAERQGLQTYKDAHCWYFTPAYFEIVSFELNCLGLIDFDVNWIEENEGSEFIVQMKRSQNKLSVEEVHGKRQALYRRAMGELTNRSPY